MAGPVQGDQEMAAENGPVLEDLSALKGGMDLLEAPSQAAGVDPVEPLAYLLDAEGEWRLCAWTGSSPRGTRLPRVGYACRTAGETAS